MRYLIFLLSTFILSPFSLDAQCRDCYDTPFLGIYSNGISKQKAKKLQFDNYEGSYVTGVIGNTAAEKAGLQPFDYVYGIDSYRTDIGRSLTAILKKYDPEDEVELHYYRNGKKQSKKIQLGKRSDARYNKRNKKEDPFLGVEQNQRNWEDDYIGVRIDVVNNSTAESIGLEDGDIISHINGFPILDWTDMGAAIDMMTVGNKMKVTYTRNGQKRNSEGLIKSLAETKYKSYDNDRDEENKEYNYSYHYDTREGQHKDGYVRADYGRNGAEVRGRNIAEMKVIITALTSALIDNLNDQHEIDLSTTNQLAVTDLSIIPNTGDGLFKITFKLSKKGITVVNVYNAEGRNIYNYDLGDFSGDFEDTIDLAQNGTGAYYLVIRQGNNHFAKELRLTKK